MGSIDIQAFVETSFTASRALKLNEIVGDCGITIMLGGKGAGKDRFLDWWWQVGASSKSIPEHLRVSPADMVLINLVPAPSGSVPVSCVAFSLILDRLKRLELVADGGRLAKSTERTKRWYTEADFLSRFFNDVLPRIQDLQPRVVVIGNAQHLEKRALHWLLLLRTYAEQGHSARHALVFSAQVEPGGEESSKFAKLMNGQSETQMVWSRKMLLSPMALPEFAAIVVAFVRRNLDAVFGSDVNANGVTKEFYEWTRGNWWYIHELIKALDRALGPTKKSGEPRVITEAVMKRLRETWVQRTGPVKAPEDSGEGDADSGEGDADSGEGDADSDEGKADSGEGKADSGEGDVDVDEG
ncbi:hypothetical protein EKD04_014635 [Chloroflexales bacterium ZM16-3]|nr:hypothetical protein [Chloroflexales bacterium ZM16-3]